MSNMKRYSLTCIHCKRDFLAARPDAVFCSDLHRKQHNRAQHMQALARKGKYSAGHPNKRGAVAPNGKRTPHPK